MKLRRLDHIAMSVRDVSDTIRFYDNVLGMEPREEFPGKWSLHFADHKISIHDVRNYSEFAKDAIPGAASFCVITDTPIEDVEEMLASKGVEIVSGPAKKHGAVSMLNSLFIQDPDGNLVEISNLI